MKRYLTIGSMCDLKGDENNTKYLIIGYKKNNKDYEAVLFPGGTTEDAKPIYFDTDDIDEVYDLGYKDKEAIQYLKKIFDSKTIRTFAPKQTVDKKDVGALSSPVGLYNIENDYYGIEVDFANKTEENTNSSVELSKYKFDENGVVAEDNVHAASVNNSSVPKYEFDENGVVIKDNTTVASVNNSSVPKYEFDENGVVIKDNTFTTSVNSSSVPKYEFDENGVVIKDNTATTSVNSSSVPKYEFDENGVVIKDNTTVATLNVSSIPRYEFDENGVVIKDNNVATSVNNSPMPKYTFDENGVVIAAQ